MSATAPNHVPLVLLHAYLTDHALWDGVIAHLGANIEVVAPDLPGFGDAPVSSEPPTIDAMADHVAGLLTSRGIARAVVAGVSMGGYVALAFAARHPQLLAGLGLISTQAWPDSPVMQRLRRSIISAVRRKGPQEASRALLPALFSPARQNDPDLIHCAKISATRTTVDGICWALEAMAHRPGRTQILKDLKVPALVVHGTADSLIPVEQARATAALLCNGQLVELQDAGHATPWEEPKAVAAALLALVRSTTPF